MVKKKSGLAGSLLILLAGVLWGSIGVFVKELNRVGATGEVTNFLRQISATFCRSSFGQTHPQGLWGLQNRRTFVIGSEAFLSRSSKSRYQVAWSPSVSYIRAFGSSSHRSLRTDEKKQL